MIMDYGQYEIWNMIIEFIVGNYIMYCVLLCDDVIGYGCYYIGRVLVNI